MVGRMVLFGGGLWSTIGSRIRGLTSVWPPYNNPLRIGMNAIIVAVSVKSI